MNEVCSDNRFEVIRIAKERLLAATNIDTSPDEMKVLDNFLFRCWQMGWLDRYEKKIKNNVPEINVGKWISCSERMPENAGFYIVTKRQKSGEIQIALGNYRPLSKEWSGNGNFKEVLAWIPLPEPYRLDSGPVKCHNCFGASNNDCRFCEDDGK